ncbi:MAG: hypothetical protein EAZ30_16015 [Betaproteobacteria bacterium]|nr:MAG: hypothetical protein EAZ43_03195 [Betaproteobacteria bacterium]TAG45204.1 MAG: hypothetical protein EAZ30_16015 [Betaproteobacteria bacterium]
MRALPQRVRRDGVAMTDHCGFKYKAQSRQGNSTVETESPTGEHSEWARRRHVLIGRADRALRSVSALVSQLPETPASV